jgi:hypothetical protein
MKMRLLLILAALAQAAPNAFAQSLSSDDRFFILMTSALTAQGQTATDLRARRANAEGFFLLAAKASSTDVLSNIVRFIVAASAAEASDHYLSAVPHTPTDLEEFATPSEISKALFVLDDSLKLLARIPTAHAVLNVSPPVRLPDVYNDGLDEAEQTLFGFKDSTPGVAASGMDPKSIQDPKLRAEYERRIAENKHAIEEINERIRLERSVRSLQVAVKGVVDSLGGEGKAEPLKSVIATSDLPTEVKAEILGHGNSQPKMP